MNMPTDKHDWKYCALHSFTGTEADSRDCGECLKLNIAAQGNKEGIDWTQLRIKFFAECTDQTDGLVGKMGELRKINIAPHNLFEWFKKNLQSPAVSGREMITESDLCLAFANGFAVRDDNRFAQLNQAEEYAKFRKRLPELRSLKSNKENEHGK